jgi:hypothetical protein
MRPLIPSLLVLLAAAAPAAAEVRTVAEVHTPTDRLGYATFPSVDAFGGRVAWSDYDSAARAWRLMERSGDVTHPVPVATRATPFDVDLGPDGRGGTRAVYSRCRRSCDLFAFSFTTGRETPIAGANSRADEVSPAAWGSRIAFVRTYRGRRGRFGLPTPYLYWRSLDGSGPSRRLRRPSPVITVRMRGKTERQRLATIIDGLDMRSRTVAYGWQRVDEDLETVSFIYLATTGGGLRAAARGATSGGGAAVSVRSVREPSLLQDGVAWLFKNSGAPRYFASFLDRPAGGAVRRSATSTAVAFARDGDVVYWIDGGPGAGLGPGGTFALKADDAVAYRRAPRGWLPMKPPR